MRKQRHHIGSSLLFLELRKSCFCPALQELCRLVVQMCVECSKIHKHRSRRLLQPMAESQRNVVFHSLAFDLLGPIRTFMIDQHSNKVPIQLHLGIFICHISRLVNIVPIGDTGRSSILDAIQQQFCGYGVSKLVFLDNQSSVRHLCNQKSFVGIDSETNSFVSQFWNVVLSIDLCQKCS